MILVIKMVGYPNGSKKHINHATNKADAGKRGMSLEADLNQSNDYYRLNQIAVIHKKPTPVQVVTVDYPSRNKARITEAYYRHPSTTDYNGIYKGYYVDFEAKETKNKTLLPLQFIHPHQLEHLASVEREGAISFVIIRFSSYNETYLVFSKDLFILLEDKTIKSITLKWIIEHGHRCPFRYQIPCDYLTIVEQERMRRLSTDE